MMWSQTRRVDHLGRVDAGLQRSGCKRSCNGIEFLRGGRWGLDLSDERGPCVLTTPSGSSPV